MSMLLICSEGTITNSTISNIFIYGGPGYGIHIGTGTIDQVNISQILATSSTSYGVYVTSSSNINRTASPVTFNNIIQIEYTEKQLVLRKFSKTLEIRH